MFPYYRKLALLAFFYCFNYKNLIHIVISYLNFKSKHHDKCKFAVKLISLANTSNFFFSLEVVQKCQHYQLSVLRENSNMRVNKVRIVGLRLVGSTYHVT